MAKLVRSRRTISSKNAPDWPRARLTFSDSAMIFDRDRKMLSNTFFSVDWNTWISLCVLWFWQRINSTRSGSSASLKSDQTSSETTSQKSTSRRTGNMILPNRYGIHGLHLPIRLAQQFQVKLNTGILLELLSHPAILQMNTWTGKWNTCRLPSWSVRQFANHRKGELLQMIVTQNVSLKQRNYSTQGHLLLPRRFDSE